MAEGQRTEDSLRQLADLGLERRIEITTADDKKDPYAKYTQQDLEALRKSVQTHQTSQLLQEKRPLLEAWSNFRQEVKIQEGGFLDEPELMDGQSHRAQLHFNMRSNEGRFFGQGAPSRQPPSGPRKHLNPALNSSGSFSRSASTGQRKHLDPALDPSKFSAAKSNHIDPALGPSRLQIGKPNTGPKLDRPKRLKIQRRPILSPRSPSIPNSAAYEVKLADPNTWLDSVRNKVAQPDTPAQPRTTPQVDTSSDIKPSKEGQPATTTDLDAASTAVAGTQLAATTQKVAGTKSAAITEPAVTIKQTATTQAATDTQLIATSRPVETKKLVTKLDDRFFKSNLPQPQTSRSILRSQPQAPKDENLLLTFDSPPKNVAQAPSRMTTEPDAMDLDNDGDEDDSDTAASRTLDKTMYWIQELGIVNDTLAELDFADNKRAKQLEERRKKLQTMIHAASKQKAGKSRQITARQERLIEVSPSPLEKAVTAQPFVPSPKPLSHKVNASVTVGLQASRWATTSKETPAASQAPPEKIAKDSSDDTVDYWQKALPKLRPLPPQETTKANSAPTPPKKATKTMYESRYAC